ncbi:acyl-CoA dehydrogenase family protein [Arthrobacter ginkgonis]|uniref:Acyl-CoA dehydrogenase family protein n=1 Tax=Arthrobacter ginkgonis TaxID=1630594 RepID=A0ABP7CHC9_9MICC
MTAVASESKPGPASQPSAVTPADLIAAAVAMRPELIERQAEVEATTYFAADTHQKFLDSRLYDMYVPKMYGGLEVEVPTFMRVALELARGCMSTAWCFSLSANHALQVASWFPRQVQDQVFANRDFRAASVSAPTVRAEKVEGGYVLNGEVAYCSGIPYATYYLGQTMVADPDGGEPRMGMFLAPRDQFERLDDWGDTLGLKGSGSHSIRFTNGFVPAEFVMEDINMVDIPVEGGTVGSELHGNGMYSGRGLSIFTMTLAAIAIGGGYNALDEFEDQMRTRKTPLPPVVSRMQDPDYQRFYGAALTKLATAEAALMNVAQQHMDLCRANVAGERPYTFVDDFRLAGIARELVVQVWETVEKDLFRNIGSSAARNGERFERVFRDMAQAAGHRNTLLREQSYRTLAQLTLGLAPATQH